MNFSSCIWQCLNINKKVLRSIIHKLKKCCKENLNHAIKLKCRTWNKTKLRKDFYVKHSKRKLPLFTPQHDFRHLRNVIYYFHFSFMISPWYYVLVHFFIFWFQKKKTNVFIYFILLLPISNVYCLVRETHYNASMSPKS